MVPMKIKAPEIILTISKKMNWMVGDVFGIMEAQIQSLQNLL